MTSGTVKEECPAYPPGSGIERCPDWLCDCFIATHPDDSPGGLHPEAFVIGPVSEDDTDT
jgi:hypothetical protein